MATSYQSNIPPPCWNTTGFRDCANQIWATVLATCAANGEVDADGNPTDDCYTNLGYYYDVQVMGNCQCNSQKAPTQAQLNAISAAAVTVNDPTLTKQAADQAAAGAPTDWTKILLYSAIGYVGYKVFFSTK
jgi:hypothetical protein